MGSEPTPSMKERDVAEVSLERVAALRRDPVAGLRWPCPFILPEWLSAWWETFGEGSDPFLFEVRRDGNIVGIAPLVRREGAARFMGSPDLCDYQDMVVVPGRGRELWEVLLEEVTARGVDRLDLASVQPESTVLTDLVPLATEQGLSVSVEPDGSHVEVDLPSSWEAFLAGLARKERHEVRRKLRRLQEAGPVRHRSLSGGEDLAAGVGAFLRLFRANRPDKAAFMTARMSRYFSALMEGAARSGTLALSLLEIGGEPAAATLCFDHDDTTFLYNNGYDRRFETLSVGILSKVLSIQESIERGQRRYDLLKGIEGYKFRLGGEEKPLFRCRIELGP